MNLRVIDTNIASIMMDLNPLLARYQPYLIGFRLVLSFQSIAEMRLGALNARWGKKRLQKLESFLSGFTIAVYTEELGRAWAQVMNDARRAGRRLEAGDGWIAATALVLGVPLVSDDRDFDDGACPSIMVLRPIP